MTIFGRLRFRNNRRSLLAILGLIFLSFGIFSGWGAIPHAYASTTTVLDATGCASIGGTFSTNVPSAGLDTCAITSSYTVNSGDVLEIPRPVILAITGSLTNDGTISNMPPDLWFGLDVSGTLNNAGIIDETGSGFIIEINGAIDNSGTITVESNTVLTNNGQITNEAAGTISINGFASELDNAGSFINHGTMTNNYNLGNSGTLDNYGLLDNPGSFSNTGTFNNKGGGTFTDTGNLHSSGTVTNDGSISIPVYGTSALYNSGTLTNDASGTIENDYTFDNSGTLTNKGTITNYYEFTNEGTIYNYRTVDNNGEIDNAVGAAIYNECGGSIVPGPNAIYNGNPPVVISCTTTTGVPEFPGSAFVPFLLIVLALPVLFIVTRKFRDPLFP